MSRDYYNQRLGIGGPPRLQLAEVGDHLAVAYEFIAEQGYLQQSFGYSCIDAGNVPGIHGADLQSALYLAAGIRVDRYLPTFMREADEVSLFTLAEFIWGHVARPEDGAGRFHSFGGCGLHVNPRTDRFDRKAAQDEWRAKINVFLKFYGEGFRLSEAGEIVRLTPDGMPALTETPLPRVIGNKDQAKVANAIRTFQLGRATREQRQQAVRELVDVLEFHRPAVKQHLLNKDEDDLFNIANNFAVRHHRPDQKDSYGDDWLTWLFYTYLATVHLVLRRVHAADPEPTGPPIQEDSLADDEFRF